MKDKSILLAEKQLVKDEIVEVASRMIKDHDSSVEKGMTEIAAKWIITIDWLMAKLDAIDNQIADCNIDKT